MTGAPAPLRGPAAPGFLDPILALVERVDRRLRRVTPIQPEGVLGLERRRHHGAAVTLADGTRIRDGDPAWIIHFDNARLRQVATAGWQTEGFRLALDDLRALAAWHAAQPAHARPVAYTGISVLGPLMRRAGFELRPRRRTPWVRLEDWYLRSLLARWAPAGRDRLSRGHRPLLTEEVWLSGDALLGRYGSSPPPPE